VETLRGSLPRDAAGLRQTGRRPLHEAVGAAERLAANLWQDHEVSWGFMSTFTKTARPRAAPPRPGPEAPHRRSWDPTLRSTPGARRGAGCARSAGPAPLPVAGRPCLAGLPNELGRRQVARPALPRPRRRSPACR
jgi:hypothetical protein